MNNNKIKKLLKINYLTEILGKKANSITSTFEVITHIIYIDTIDLAHKDIIIEIIYIKSTN